MAWSAGKLRSNSTSVFSIEPGERTVQVRGRFPSFPESNVVSMSVAAGVIRDLECRTVTSIPSFLPLYSRALGLLVSRQGRLLSPRSSSERRDRASTPADLSNGLLGPYSNLRKRAWPKVGNRHNVAVSDDQSVYPNDVSIGFGVIQSAQRSLAEALEEGYVFDRDPSSIVPPSSKGGYALVGCHSAPPC